jgi:hypothetical protein
MPHWEEGFSGVDSGSAFKTCEMNRRSAESREFSPGTLASTH